MNYKIYKRLISENREHIDDNKFVLGINIGMKFTTISMFKPTTKDCEPIDHSGGYGSFAIPTVMQYIDETNEWVFGETALLNSGAFSDVTFHNIVDRLGNNEYIEVFGKIYSTYKILGMFISNTVSKCFDLNPQGQIGGIIVCHPYYFTEEQIDELYKSFKYAGLEKEVIAYVKDYDCIFSYYSKQHNFKTGSHVMLIDYGFNEIRGNIFKIDDNTITSIIYKSNENIAGKNIDSKLLELFTVYYCDEFKTKPSMLTNDHMTKLGIFVYQHKNMLLSGKQKNINLYFNFCHPPFQKNVSIETIEAFINPLKYEFQKFVYELIKTAEYEGIKKDDIQTVIGVGGGFNMSFAKNIMYNFFEDAIISPKCQGIHSLGASLVSAMELTIIDKVNFNFLDYHKIKEDYGFMALNDKREKFIAMFEKNSFWWDARGQLNFILDDDAETPKISILSRNSEGELSEKGILSLSDIPKRPKKMTRLAVQMWFKQYNIISIKITDLGFGEFYPPQDMVISKEITV